MELLIPRWGNYSYQGIQCSHFNVKQIENKRSNLSISEKNVVLTVENIRVPSTRNSCPFCLYLIMGWVRSCRVTGSKFLARTWPITPLVSQVRIFSCIFRVGGSGFFSWFRSKFRFAPDLSHSRVGFFFRRVESGLSSRPAHDQVYSVIARSIPCYHIRSISLNAFGIVSD
jgi:hypothetical protein